MRFHKFLSLSFVVVGLLSSGCTKKEAQVQGVVPEDKYLFLEQRESAEAIAWAKPRSEKTVQFMTSRPRYTEIKKNIADIRLAKDRLVAPDLMGEYVYNFWTDEAHKKGVWRRTLAKDFDAGAAKWEELIDVAKLAQADGKNWVWKGDQCLEPSYRYCLVHLSDGGEDATIVREYDTLKKEFRADGFALPEAKHQIAWYSEDVLLLATDFGPGSLTNSEYPRTVRRWERGAKFTDAKLIYEGKTEDVSVAVFTEIRDGKTFAAVSRAPSFFEQEFARYSDEKGIEKLPLPLDSEVLGVFEDKMLVRIRKDWKLGTVLIGGGTLLSLPVDSNDLNVWKNAAQVIYGPDERSTLESIYVTDDRVFLNTINDVKGKMIVASLDNGVWALESTELPADGVLTFLTGDKKTGKVYVEYQSFLSPTTYYRGDMDDDGAYEWTQTAQLAARFDAKGLISEQRFATSKDGTKVPYFVVRKGDFKFNGENPTLLYGYGGFEISLLPRYSAETGKNWIEKGGVYVVANIRGGGEFGPKWHQAALLEKRQNAYDDFIAVAEDLIANHYTSPRRLGIKGGSNGGLLVGAVTMQRPELFNAVLCSVPLLDMVRYQLLPPGDSWTGEYGSPNDPIVGPVIRSYSPYQNIKKDKKYPKIYFWSSLKDDRVHPGHARKMVARMEEYGHDVYYYESSAGGHGGAGDIDQAISDEAMAMTYLYSQLVD